MPLWILESPKSAEWAVRLDTQKELLLRFKCEGHLLAEFPFVWEFILCRPSPDWTRPTLTLDDNVLYSKPTHLNVNII